jgi:multidrug efflux pump subunit AcrB
MLASYLLSRTLVPTLAKFWLKRHDAAHAEGNNVFTRFQKRFERGFERMREGYRAVLVLALTSGPRFAAIFLLSMAATALLAFPIGPLPGLGQDFFPSVDGGQIKLHVRARTGTRIEETAALCDAI